MLHRFIAFIDGLGDRINPVTVLWFRRLKGWQSLVPLTMIVHAVIFFCLLFADLMTGPFLESLREMYILFPLMSPTFMCFGAATNGPFLFQKLDPLLLLTPLSDRQVRIGFLLTGFVMGIWGWSLTVLIYSYLYALRIVSLEWVLLYPLISLVVAWTIMAAGASLSAAVKKTWQFYIVFPIYFLPLWCGMMFFFSPPWRLLITEMVLHRIPISAFSPKILAAVFVVTVPVVLFVARRLFDYNLDRSRSFFQKLVVTLAVYLGVTLFSAGFWYLLWFLFR